VLSYQDRSPSSKHGGYKCVQTVHANS